MTADGQRPRWPLTRAPRAGRLASLALLSRLLVTVMLALAGAGIRAEPYLAVQTGLRCAQCHVNQTGGGMRTPFGNVFAQNQLAANRLPGAASDWRGTIGTWFGIGANVRGTAFETKVAGSRQSESFDLREARVYLSFTPIADRLSFYVDQFVGPGASSNREAFVRWSATDGGLYLKAGRFYLPFGWRLQDNTALVRTQSAIDMIGPDRGVEIGWDPGPLSIQFAVSNGTFGRSEVDDGKQYSLQLAHLRDAWRVGVGANFNDQDIGDRAALGLFAGLRTGPVAWLAEIDLIDDRSAFGPSGRKLRSSAWLLEGNWRVAQGHNLKLSGEALDPDHDRSTNRQSRVSVVYEYTPIGYLQLRGGWRRYSGPSESAFDNRRLGFVELHALF